MNPFESLKIPTDLVDRLHDLAPGKDAMITFVAIGQVVAQSFRDDNRKLIWTPPSRNEVRHRFILCIELFNTMRGDLKWSGTKAVDSLPYALRCKLDGQDWVPNEKAMWCPETNARMARDANQ